MSDTEIKPFSIDIGQNKLDDLSERLTRTRWPDELPNVDWDYGVPLDYLKELAEYWRTEYEWREHEAALNEFPQFTTTIDGQTIHFLHVHSDEPDALPLILSHGWPNTFTEFLDMVASLTDPAAHGGDPADAFHVVIPSLPGYGFSGSTHDIGWNSRRIAETWDTLMKRLGYDQYGAQGGDGGSLVCRELGVLEPEGLVGVHVMQIFAFPSEDPDEMAELTEDDQKSLEILSDFEELAGFSSIQATRPQTLAYALADSPVGQLAWNLELPSGFGDTIDLLDRDLLLTNVTLYWLTNTAGSSARMYYEDAHADYEAEEENAVPTGVAVFPNDFQTIRSFAERANTNIIHWSEFDRGGHFAAMEVPELLVDDLREFFRGLR
ncbi:epoxide hydrolase family protein [Haladaptatus halobius]|uniref:epoxide hydrolase family protein n=1 Tax=Haladaptatus halobius TaxID=2884875 RepID=UPI001D0A3800|nr:epoxide hydrolase family protein [Haladaptatus halobius]